jgi:hypothetical protein
MMHLHLYAHTYIYVDMHTYTRYIHTVAGMLFMQKMEDATTLHDAYRGQDQVQMHHE